jgi:hypothetical protein
VPDAAETRERKRAAAARWRARHPERVIEARLRWVERNREKLRADARIRARRQPPLTEAQKKRKQITERARLRANPEIGRQKTARWAKNNKPRVLASNARREAIRKLATPAWADKKMIRNFYKEARRLTEKTGIQHHVDHIVPLISPVVCGLHVEHNLQVMAAVDNVRKGNLSC